MTNQTSESLPRLNIEPGRLRIDLANYLIEKRHS
jgi:hypothetical protein